ncbi:MAG: cytochrome b/b6 domain-containing protein [Deltaproteobacteria bacterium]|nr:cytochrome b/b6 domain-containing protein [Deltaproteobacteria bacterium]
MANLVYRHNRITRLTHWINALALLILLMSGLQIFNAYPHLHWGSKAEPEEAFFSIYAANEDGEIRGWHFFFAWLFALNGLLYFFYNLARGHVRKFFFTPRDFSRLLPMALYYLRLRRESPQAGEYNPLQKMAYTGVFFFLTPLIFLSGFAMSPQLDAAFNWLPAMFGGRQSARTVHFLLTFLFAFFTFGHVVMVMTTGVINNMRSMVTGWYVEGEKTPETTASSSEKSEPPANKEAHDDAEK